MTSGHSDARGWVSECPDVINYKWQLNLVWQWHRMLYNCTHLATVSVKGLTVLYKVRQTSCCEASFFVFFFLRESWNWWCIIAYKSPAAVYSFVPDADVLIFIIMRVQNENIKKQERQLSQTFGQCSLFVDKFDFKKWSPYFISLRRCSLSGVVQIKTSTRRLWSDTDDVGFWQHRSW